MSLTRLLIHRAASHLRPHANARTEHAAQDSAPIASTADRPTDVTDAVGSGPRVEPSISRNASGGSLRTDLRASLVDGAMYSIMVGMWESYLPALVLALGLGEIAAGLVVSVPLLIGACLQMVSPRAVACLGSNRRWVITCVFVQALCFIPWMGAALRGHASLVMVFAVAAVYWAASLGAGPAWNTWMEAVVPRSMRVGFFASRSRMSQVGVMLGFILGGVTLHFGRTHGRELLAFAAILGAASICRFISGRFLLLQREDEPGPLVQTTVSARELCRRIARGSSERMLLVFLAVQVAVQLSGPYFTPYLLQHLKISYLEFMTLLATCFVGKGLAMPVCGRIAYRHGAQYLLWVGMLGITPIAAIWMFAQTFWSLVLLQFVAGVVWAAYELAMFLLFFETVRREDRTSILTTFNLMNSAAVVTGALLGSAFLKLFNQVAEAYLLLFLLSSVARAFLLLMFRRSIGTPTGEPSHATESDLELDVRSAAIDDRAHDLAAETGPVTPALADSPGGIRSSSSIPAQKSTLPG